MMAAPAACLLCSILVFGFCLQAEASSKPDSSSSSWSQASESAHLLGAAAWEVSWHQAPAGRQAQGLVAHLHSR